jgi:hypothetical protein
MITNAILVSLATPSSSAAGRVTYSNITAVGSRCFIGPASAQQTLDVGASVEDEVAAMIVPKSVAPDMSGSEGQRATVRIDGSSQANYRIEKVENLQKSGGLAHWRCTMIGMD